MVIFLLRHSASHALNSRIPVGLVVVQSHTNGVRLNLPAYLVEEIKLKFRQNQHGISNTTVFHILFGSQDDVPGILRKRAVFGMVNDHGVAGHGQSGDLTERIDNSGVRIGDKNHIAFFNNSVSVIRCVEANTVFHDILCKIGGGNGHVSELAVDIHHFEIHHSDILFLNEGHNIVHIFTHN